MRKKRRAKRSGRGESGEEARLAASPLDFALPAMLGLLNRPLSRNAETKDFARLTSHPVRG